MKVEIDTQEPAFRYECSRLRDGDYCTFTITFFLYELPLLERRYVDNDYADAKAGEYVYDEDEAIAKAKESFSRWFVNAALQGSRS